MVKKAAEATPNHLLRAARKERNWTQKDVADRIGSPQSFNVSRWEQGTAFPSAHYIQQLCLLFGKSAKELGLATEEPIDGFQLPAEADDLHLWNVPYRRNPFFTGREEALQQLHGRLTTSQSVALTQTQAISGLGGIGKTQIAVEYAYRYCDEYHLVTWMRAASRDALISDFVSLARLLHLIEKDAQDQNIAIAAVKRWLEHHTGWLLVLDNADDLEMVTDFLPTQNNGHILLTSRAQATGSIALSIVIEKMDYDEGMLLLLRRAKLLAPDATLDQATQQNLIRARATVVTLDGLPLALDQAGAYIEETGCSIDGYLEIYSARRKELLQRRSLVRANYRETVASTWALSFLKVEQANSAAADLLRLCAFLDPDAIPEELITASASELGLELGKSVADPFKLNRAIEELRKFSLVRRDPDAKMLNIHRLVQAVIKDGMDEQTQRQWSERTVRAVNAAFPEVRFDNWQRCQEYLPHAQVCARLIEQYNFTFPEAAQLLALTGQYLRERAMYIQAESLLQRALIIEEQVLSPKHLEIANRLNDLARLYRDLGKNEQAEPLLQRALAIQEQVLGPEHPLVAYSFNNLARHYHARAQFERAEQLYQRALAISLRVLGPEHLNTITSFINLLGIYYVRGKYEQAESLLKQALKLSEQVFGPEHPSTANSLNNLAAFYYVQDELALAEPLLQRTLGIREKIHGPEHPSTATILNNLALLYYLPGKLEQAESLMKRALAIREQALGLEHPTTIDSINNMAVLYLIQGKYMEAEQLYQRALHFCEQTLDPEHPRVGTLLNNLAILYYTQGELEQAHPLLQRALAIWEHTVGRENHFTALCLNNLAVLYQVQGKYEQAASLYQRILIICEKGLVPNYLDVATYFENYADLLREMKL